MNVGVGYHTIYANRLSSWNVAVGDSALFSYAGTATQGQNTAVGGGSLAQATTAYQNAALGFDAGNLVNTGGQVTAIGAFSGPTADVANQSDLGYLAGNANANCVVLGNNAITKIYAATTTITLSDRRIKNNIQADVHGLDFIMKLQPVTYNYDVHMADHLTGVDSKLAELSPDAKKLYEVAVAEKERIKFSGFIAQDVESAANAVGYDFSGIAKPQGANSIYGLGYADFVVPLVKSVQEQQNMIDAQKALIEKLNARIDMLQKEMEQLKTR